MSSIAIDDHQSILMTFFDKESEIAIDDEQKIYILAPILDLINSGKTESFDSQDKDSPTKPPADESTSGSDGKNESGGRA